jgi:hypothetical protein
MAAAIASSTGEEEWRSEDPREVRVMGDELDAKIEVTLLPIFCHPHR